MTYSNEQIDTPPKDGEKVWTQKRTIFDVRTETTKPILNTTCYGVAPSVRVYHMFSSVLTELKVIYIHM